MLTHGQESRRGRPRAHQVTAQGSGISTQWEEGREATRHIHIHININESNWMRIDRCQKDPLIVWVQMKRKDQP